MGPLAWLGRQRSRAVAGMVLVALALPPLGQLLRPYVTEAVIVLLAISFMRVDLGAFARHLRRPALVLAATGWSLLAVPGIVALVCLATGVDTALPGLFLALMLQTATSPMMAAPAFAALLGLDAALVLAVLLVASIATPISAPFVVAVLELPLSLSPFDLGVKLLAIFAGSAALGLLARRLLGAGRLARYEDEIDGVNIVTLFVFISAVVGDVGVRFIGDPLLMLGLLVLAFAVFVALGLATHLLFMKAGPGSAFALAIVVSLKNIGLMLAATGGAVPELAWLYFAVSQFPIYLAPLLLQPLARRITVSAAAPKDRPRTRDRNRS